MGNKIETWHSSCCVLCFQLVNLFLSGEPRQILMKYPERVYTIVNEEMIVVSDVFVFLETAEYWLRVYSETQPGLTIKEFLLNHDKGMVFEIEQ